MKEIKAYIRPEKVDHVIVALEKEGIHGMTIINVSAMADWADPERTAFSVKYVERYCKVVKLELICPASQENRLIEAIRKAAFTGKKGDGKIFVSRIDDAISVRTSLHGAEAI